jgi:uncharacterized protein with HEPN domain
MSKRTDSDFLHHISEAAERIIAYTETMGCEGFFEDIKTQDAVIRNIEIIGEATKNLAGMRDRLIHHYFGVNLDIVWDVVKEELPQLLQNINRIKRLDQ